MLKLKKVDFQVINSELILSCHQTSKESSVKPDSHPPSGVPTTALQQEISGPHEHGWTIVSIHSCPMSVKLLKNTHADCHDVGTVQYLILSCLICRGILPFYVCAICCNWDKIAFFGETSHSFAVDWFAYRLFVFVLSLSLFFFTVISVNCCWAESRVYLIWSDLIKTLISMLVSLIF